MPRAITTHEWPAGVAMTVQTRKHQRYSGSCRKFKLSLTNVASVDCGSYKLVMERSRVEVVTYRHPCLRRLT